MNIQQRQAIDIANTMATEYHKNQVSEVNEIHRISEQVLYGKITKAVSESKCVGICKLGLNNICVGCGRSFQEINNTVS